MANKANAEVFMHRVYYTEGRTQVTSKDQNIIVTWGVGSFDLSLQVTT